MDLTQCKACDYFEDCDKFEELLDRAVEIMAEREINGQDND